MQRHQSLRERLLALNRHAGELAAMSEELRTKGILEIARGLEENSVELLAENAKDVTDAMRDGVSSPLVKRLVLDEEKLLQMIRSMHAVAGQDPVVGELIAERELDDGLLLRQLRCPIGVVAFIFESRPDAFVQMLSLSLKSANALVLKGGSEASRTNACLFRVAESALARAGLPPCLCHLTTREEIAELLSFDDIVALVIPRGSKEFVREIMQRSDIPVLGHADGICHIYVDADADAAMAKEIVVDAKTQYVAVCNALETLLVHRSAKETLKDIVTVLIERGVHVKGDDRVRALFPQVEAAEDADWSTEYLDLILSIRMVDSVEEAVEHINRYGSHHTDAIVTKCEAHAAYFVARVSSANTFVNCSTRFSDGYRYGLGAESGISTGKLHARGPVGIEGLTTYRWLLEGKGHIVADYEEGRKTLHHRERKV